MKALAMPPKHKIRTKSPTNAGPGGIGGNPVLFPGRTPPPILSDGAAPAPCDEPRGQSWWIRRHSLSGEDDAIPANSLMRFEELTNSCWIDGCPPVKAPD